MTPTSLFRLAATPMLAALALSGCSTLIEPDPLNKTTSIVNGTQITRGPTRGVLPSGFAATAAPTSTSFEPAVGEPFDVDVLGANPGDDLSLPELQGLDFGAEQAGVDGIIASGGLSPAEGGAFSFAEIGQAVYFATDSSELDERARETLRRQAAWMNVNPEARATIEGHADERGTREYNLALGDRRASATRGYLIAVGVDESRLDKISYGKERPVALESNAQAWARNRRTETVIEGGDAFANAPAGGAPFESAAFDAGVTTGPLDPLSYSDFTTPGSVADPSGDLLLDPLYSGQDSGSISYETTSGLYAPPVQTPAYDGGTISPGVFDSGVATTTTTGTSGRGIGDVSVDDLLRDPNLIDRIGPPVTTTPATPGT